MHFQFDEPSIACSGDLFMPALAQNAYVHYGPQKQTWCIAATQTCFDGSVLNVMAARLVVEQFI